MTNEEAIKTLKGEAWICCGEKWNEALEMASKALEKEPCEDCISRQYLVEKAMSSFTGAKYVALTDILDAPPVTPVEKVGHLIDVDGGVECSGCGHWYPHASIAKRVLKYCNKCGMKLEVQDEDSD